MMNSKNNVQLAVLIVAWGAVISLFHFSGDTIIGTDDFFHIQVAEILSESGIILKEFPYATESVWSDNYFDKEWLFHVFLIPFTAGDKIVGIKAAVLILNIGIVLALWNLFRVLELRHPLIWILCIPFTAYSLFWTRILVCRPHLASIIILFLSISFLIQRRRFALFFVSILYALTYTGHWQLPCLAIFYDIIFGFIDDHGRRRVLPNFKVVPMTMYIGLGTIIGECLHPNFPHNIHGLYLQNIMILQSYWGQNNDVFLMRPQELYGISIGNFIFNFAPIIFAIVLIAVDVLKQGCRLNRNGYLFAGFTAIYLLFTLKSVRFLEYFVPMSVTFCAIYCQSNSIYERVKRRPVKIVFLLAFILFGLLGIAKCYVKYGYVKSIKQQNVYLYAGASEWLKTFVNDDEIIFTSSWDQTPPLFFGAPNLRYLVFLDPYFMYAKSPERFRLWHQIRMGLTASPAAIIQEIFGSKFVFVTPEFSDFVKQLDDDPIAEKVYTGPVGEMIFSLLKTPPETNR